MTYSSRRKGEPVSKDQLEFLLQGLDDQLREPEKPAQAPVLSKPLTDALFTPTHFADEP